MTNRFGFDIFLANFYGILLNFIQNKAWLAGLVVVLTLHPTPFLGSELQRVLRPVAQNGIGCDPWFDKD